VLFAHADWLAWRWLAKYYSPPTSPRKTKRLLVSNKLTLKQVKLLFGPLVIQLVGYILKQLLISVSVKVADIFFAARGWVNIHQDVCQGNWKRFCSFFLWSPIEKLAISVPICLFSCGFLHCNKLWQLRFQSILMRVLCDFYFLFFSLPKFAQKIGHFRKFSHGPPFAILQKSRHFRQNLSLTEWYAAHQKEKIMTCAVELFLRNTFSSQSIVNFLAEYRL